MLVCGRAACDKPAENTGAGGGGSVIIPPVEFGNIKIGTTSPAQSVELSNPFNEPAYATSDIEWGG